jgi:peptidyl-prolyl cis-trans isomerase SurA
MKGLFPVIFLSLLASCLTGLSQVAHNVWDPPFRQGIAAEVEDKIITFEELRREMSPLIPQIRESSRSRAEFNRRMEELYFEVLQSLIDRILIVKEFRKREFNIPQTYIENEFDRILIEDFDRDRARFLEYLDSIGKNVREFRADLRERIIVSVMRGEKRRSESQISPERIERFYSENKIHFYEEESVRLRIIMLRPLADESEDLMRQNIERVQEELKAGKEFAEVARQFSQDSRRDRGGDWGWIKRSDLKDELSVVGFRLEIGQYSEPIRLGNQIFFLYVEDRRDEGIQPLNEVRERIEEILAGQLARQAQEQWLERLRRESYIKFY